MKKALVIKAALFAAIFAILLSVAYRILVSHDDYRNYQWIAGFYEEEENSLDAVYIGGSNTYAFWVSPIAWKEYGICIYPFACNSQPLIAAEYLIREARKTQPDALYIVSINGISGIGDTVSDKQIHYLTDYMPWSLDRLSLINYLCEVGEIPTNERMELYFPFVLYHSRWEELSKEDFHYTNNGLKGGATYGGFFNTSNDVTSNFRETSRHTVLMSYLQEALDSLLDYCDAEKVNVLFVTAPQMKINEYDLAVFNTVNDKVESRGYSHLDMLPYIDEIGLDLKVDYYNEYHTNIHGALKTTRYLSEYLLENYDFSNITIKHDNASWDLAYEKYIKLIGPYTLDIERNAEPRDNLLLAPKLSKVSVDGTSLTVTWEKSDGADGYQIYRKDSESAWIKLGG